MGIPKCRTKTAASLTNDLSSSNSLRESYWKHCNQLLAFLIGPAVILTPSLDANHIFRDASADGARRMFLVKLRVSSQNRNFSLKRASTFRNRSVLTSVCFK